MICLDTNAGIRFLRGRPEKLVERIEEALLHAQVAISAVTLFELHYGVAKSARRRENSERLLLFLQLPISVLSLGTRMRKKQETFGRRWSE